MRARSIVGDRGLEFGLGTEHRQIWAIVQSGSMAMAPVSELEDIRVFYS